MLFSLSLSLFVEEILQVLSSSTFPVQVLYLVPLLHLVHSKVNKLFKYNLHISDISSHKNCSTNTKPTSLSRGKKITIAKIVLKWCFFRKGLFFNFNQVLSSPRILEVLYKYIAVFQVAGFTQLESTATVYKTHKEDLSQNIKN